MNQTAARDSTGSWQAIRESWVSFWFSPIDPWGMHIIRICSGLLFLTWLLSLGSEREALFGLGGWLDTQAYRELSRLPDEAGPPVGWSILFLCGNCSSLVTGTYILSLLVFALLTLGIATRLTSLLSWIVVTSFTANPATHDDTESVLVILAFYLMIGYLFQRHIHALPIDDQSAAKVALGSKRALRRPLGRIAVSSAPSVAANVALRLLQIHMAVVVFTSGVHKLQSGEWWAGVALWYPLFPPSSATIEHVRSHIGHAIPMLFGISLATYVTIAWQIAFPAFAWRSGWRIVLLGGAFLGCLGSTWLYELPVFGPAILIGCLSYVAPDEWRQTRSRLRTLVDREIERV